MPVRKHRLAVRDEDELDRQFEQRQQRLAQRVVRDRGEVQPRRRTHAYAARLVADQPVARDQRAVLGDPDHGLAGALDLHRLDSARRGSRIPSADLRPAALVAGHRRDDGDGAARDELVERLPLVDERIDEHDDVPRVVGDAADVAQPIADAVLLGARLPLRVRRGPAVQTPTELLHAG